MTKSFKTKFQGGNFFYLFKFLECFQGQRSVFLDLHLVKHFFTLIIKGEGVVGGYIDRHALDLISPTRSIWWKSDCLTISIKKPEENPFYINFKTKIITSCLKKLCVWRFYQTHLNFFFAKYTIFLSTFMFKELYCFYLIKQKGADIVKQCDFSF